MLIHRELFRTNLFLQSRGIGALQRNSMFMLEEKKKLPKKIQQNSYYSCKNKEAKKISYFH